jgi:hypothetical protein
MYSGNVLPDSSIVSPILRRRDEYLSSVFDWTGFQIVEKRIRLF